MGEMGEETRDQTAVSVVGTIVVTVVGAPRIGEPLHRGGSGCLGRHLGG